MRDYGKISTSVWRSKKFLSLKSDQHRLFYLYLHTCPHVNSTGCFILPIGYAQADIGWTEESIKKAIDSLSKAYLIAFDSKESLIRIVGFLEHDPLTNPKHAQGAVKIALCLPDCPEKLHLFNELSKDFFASKDDRVAKAIERLSREYRNPEPEPEPEPIISVEQKSAAPKKVAQTESVQRIFNHWRETHRHQKAALDDKRKKVIEKALQAYSEEDICNAISGYRNSSHHMGQNERSTVYDAIELFLKDAAHIDAGLKLYIEPPTSTGKPETIFQRAVRVAKEKGLPAFRGAAGDPPETEMEFIARVSG